MTREEIQKIAEHHQKISDRNYMNYQQSGESRYLRAHEKAEDIIDICRLAMSAADDHQMNGTYRFHIAQWGSEAVSLLHHKAVTDPDAEQLLRNIKAVALMYGLTTDPWEENR